MTEIKIIKKSTAIFLLMFLLATILVFIPHNDLGKDIAYAASNDEIFYSDNSYSDNGEFTIVTETLSYATKESSPIYRINSTFPNYYNKMLNNACANVAGANLIGYYDRYYENLIPNCVTGLKRGNNYNYFSMSTISTQISDLIHELYVRMGTNAPNLGTTQEGYKNGITSYVQSKNYNVEFASVMNSDNLNFNKVQQAINNGDPISLYLSGYNIVAINDNGINVELKKYLYTGNHIMIVYGYQILNY